MLQNKLTLMFHEVDESIFDIDLEKYILTFDDGLYTQYKLIDRLCELNTTKIFFISSNIICDENVKQSEENITCHEAHQLHFRHGVNFNYMKWSDVKDIDQRDQCYVGCHSHYHRHYQDRIPIKDYINDTKLMIQEFNKQLGYIPTKFCFPYNFNCCGYKEYLQAKGFTDFYADERLCGMDELTRFRLKMDRLELEDERWVKLNN